MKIEYGCCGLNCLKCDAYIATVNDDNELRERTAELWARLNNAPITPDMINCMGCRTNGVKTPYCEYLCEVRKCAIQKAHPSCAECPELNSCKLMATIIQNAPEVVENLKAE